VLSVHYGIILTDSQGIMVDNLTIIKIIDTLRSAYLANKNERGYCGKTELQDCGS
jgi:hypothetical protein